MLNILLGVTFSEWKPKDGECKKCDGGGGPFVIEGVCEKKEHSCRGQKNKSKDSKDCVTYCSSASSLGRKDNSLQKFIGSLTASRKASLKNS